MTQIKRRRKTVLSAPHLRHLRIVLGAGISLAIGKRVRG